MDSPACRADTRRDLSREPVMIVRRAASADLAAVTACVEASLQATYGGLWTSAPLKAGDADWASAWVACDPGRILGVGLTAADRVSDLWVHPSAQGRGAGTALLARLEAEIADRGFGTGRLRCLEVNVRSRAFYAARGWVEVRIHPHETIPLNTVDLTKRVG
jgi:GNAT superfamily N-acetyltransferase